MSGFEQYYKSEFRAHINKFLLSIPEKSRHHHRDKSTYTIQYERLSRDFDHLDFLDEKAKVNFGVSLFFTVLVDQVFYTYYKNEYNGFRKLTMYPKFIGNCLSLCHYHFHPSEIFNAINYKRKRTTGERIVSALIFSPTFKEAMPVMKNEVISFFDQYLIQVNGVQFWNYCQKEFPFVFSDGSINN